MSGYHASPVVAVYRGVAKSCRPIGQRLKQAATFSCWHQKDDFIMEAKNVLGGTLKSCCNDPVTGFYRDGYCHTGPEDRGNHSVCAKVTEDFLQFTASKGNDLSTPRPEFGFKGLKPGDGWCLCAARWYEAYEAGHAPLIDLEATHEAALQVIPLELMKRYARQGDTA